MKKMCKTEKYLPTKSASHRSNNIIKYLIMTFKTKIFKNNQGYIFLNLMIGM